MNELLNLIKNSFSGGELKDYQKKIVNFFNKSKENVLLLYLTVGCGKTITSLTCAAYAKSVKDSSVVVILSPKSVQDEFKENLKLLSTFKDLPAQVKESIKELNNSVNTSKSFENIHFIAYNANNSQVKFKEILEKYPKNTNYIFIIDELHLFLRGVIKVNLEEGEKIGNIGNAKNIYDRIINVTSKKVLGLTGTPAAKYPFELIPFFNISKSNLFPNVIETFEKKYITENSQGMKVFKNVSEIRSKLKGLVVYKSLDSSESVKVITESPKTGIKESHLEEVAVEMSESQYRKYLKDYSDELDEKGFTKTKNIYGLSFGMKSSFHAKTFQDSIYVGPKDKLEISKRTCPKIIKMYNDSSHIKGLCVFYFKFVELGVKVMEQKLINEGYTKYIGKPGKHYI